ncbi:MAG: PPC domain-containing protein [Phycisphaerae bacterium]
MKYAAIFLVFTLSVCAVAEEIDYGNDMSTATAIAADSGSIQGVLASDSDQDWFLLQHSGLTLFRFNLTNAEYNWKYIRIYRQDEFGLNYELFNTGTYANYVNVSIFSEVADDLYVCIYGAAGPYSVAVTALGTYPEDNWSDDCASPSALEVGGSYVEGTITHFDPIESLPADVDWFEFQTDLLHAYQITLLDVDNDELYFSLYKDDCESPLASYLRSFNFVSREGGAYKLRISGNGGHMGEYYKIRVEDAALYTDDYFNTAETAQNITADGTRFYGNIDYTADMGYDEDWFFFTPAGNTMYRFTVNNPEYNWKYMSLYSEDSFGYRKDLTTQGYYYQARGMEIFIEGTDKLLIMFSAQGQTGNYWFSVVPVAEYLPDSYSDSCFEPTPITVGETVFGTINRADAETSTPLDQDWFSWLTLAKHKYQIIMAQSDLSNSYYDLYRADCTPIGSWLHSTTYVAQDDVVGKLYVHGDNSMIGEFYSIGVVDLGPQEDDYPDHYSQAYQIDSLDGSSVSGQVDYAADYGYDVDCFKFVAPLYGRYTLTFDNNGATGWMYLEVNGETGTPDMQQITLLSNYYNNAPSVSYLYLEAGTYYLAAYIGNNSETGAYELSILSPEPRCGDLAHPFPAGDVNGDCVVDLLDLSEIAANWLVDVRPPASE